MGTRFSSFARRFGGSITAVTVSQQGHQIPQEAVMPTDHTSCQYCNSRMTPQLDRLDLGWAGDGPYEEFAGILADVYHCDGCGRVAVLPVRIERAVRAA